MISKSEMYRKSVLYQSRITDLIEAKEKYLLDVFGKDDLGRLIINDFLLAKSLFKDISLESIILKKIIGSKDNCFTEKECIQYIRYFLDANFKKIPKEFKTKMEKEFPSLFKLIGEIKHG